MNLIYSRKGSALTLVVIVMVVLMILGAALLSSSVSETRQAVAQEHMIQANYLARAGVDEIANKILEDEAIPAGINIGDTIDIDAERRYVVEELHSLAPSHDGFFVSVRGESRGSSRRVGITITRDQPSEVLDKAIFTYATLDIRNVDVEGNVGSGGDVLFHPNKYDTDEYDYEEGVHYDNPYGGVPIEEDPRSEFNLDYYEDEDDNEVRDLLVNSHVTISSDMKLDSATVGNSSSHILEFDTGGSENTLIVAIERLEIMNQGFMRVTGDGLLKLYIMDELEAKGSIIVEPPAQMELFAYSGALLEFQTPLSVNGDEDPNQVRIYLDSGSVLDMQANGNYNAYIIGPDAEIYMQSANTTVNGAIFGNVLSRGNNQGANGKVNYFPPDDSMWDLLGANYQKRFYQ